MAGNPENARQWADADVFVAFDTAAANPATVDDPFGSAWDLVGILDGDAGFVEGTSEDENDIFGWGGLLIRTARRNFIMTRQFTAMEISNPVVDRLRYPGSTNTQIVVPSGNQIERVKIAFEVVDGDIVRRVITANYAEVRPSGDVTESEQGVTSVQFTAKIFPTGQGVLFTRQTNEVLSS